MDIRDITERPPMIEDGSGLKRMFDLQKELINDYVKIEEMPMYPISMNSKPDQLLIKDFIGRVVEELAEAMESHLLMIEMLNKNELDGIESHLQNFNEELSDSLHFLLETMIYINLDYEDVVSYYDVLLTKAKMKDTFWYGGQDPLKTAMAFAKQVNALKFLTPKLWETSFKVIPDDKVKDEFLRGGRVIDPDYHMQMEVMMWKVVYHLNISRNFLKNKPWKQSHMVTDSARFHMEIMEAWLAFFNLMDFLGMTPDSLFLIYFKKNKVNAFRIQSKY